VDVGPVEEAIVANDWLFVLDHCLDYQRDTHLLGKYVIDGQFWLLLFFLFCGFGALCLNFRRRDWGPGQLLTANHVKEKVTKGWSCVSSIARLIQYDTISILSQAEFFRYLRCFNH